MLCRRTVPSGGWRHCNIAKLNADFTGFVSFPDASTFKKITTEGYLEGPFMFNSGGEVLLHVVGKRLDRAQLFSRLRAKADSPFGPFQRIGRIPQQGPKVATGAGPHSVIQVPDKDPYYLVYHRRPLGATDGNHRVPCIDEMFF